MQSLQKAITSAIIVSEISHVFCCGLPVLFSLLSLLSVVGMASAMPMGFAQLHEMMHAYEIPMIIFSGMMVLLGWGLHYISRKLDCRSTGCGHEPCAPKKKSSGRMLVFASALFVANVTIYTVFHYIPMQYGNNYNAPISQHDDHAHHQH